MYRIQFTCVSSWLSTFRIKVFVFKYYWSSKIKPTLLLPNSISITLSHNTFKYNSQNANSLLYGKVSTCSISRDVMFADSVR
jgi:ABC-type uncharacterized transport system permease subunit